LVRIFSGVYLGAALLKIFEHSLLKLSGPRIRQWLEEVGMNKPDWYRNLSVSVPEEVEKSVSGGDVKFLPDDWAVFTKGWIHCTTGNVALVHNSHRFVCANSGVTFTRNHLQR
jgi:hypothetical protein